MTRTNLRAGPSENENRINFVCPIWTKTSIMISGTPNIFHPLFCLESQIMTLSLFSWKSDLLCHLSFTQLFHDVEIFWRRPEIIMKVIQRFLCVQHVGLISKKIHHKQPKLPLWQNIVKTSCAPQDFSYVFMPPQVNNNGCFCVPRIAKHYPAWKLELFSPQSRYIGQDTKVKEAYERQRTYISFSEKVIFDVKPSWSTGKVWSWV